MSSGLEVFKHADSWASLATLTGLEVVLGIDNIVFLTLTTNKLPAKQQPAARSLGLALALFMRLGLLFGLTWVMSLTSDLFSLLGHAFSTRDLILLGGGLFLIAKSTHEMFERLEVEGDKDGKPVKHISFGFAVAQIVLLDIVFSLDSVITAVGMAQHLSIMATAVVIAVFVMLLFAGAIGRFVNRHPSMRILALSFLLLIGVLLVAEGMRQHINKGYVYFAMAFSLGVELINMKLRVRKQAPVELHNPYEDRAQ
ncbi:MULTISPECIES: TerC family protein [Polyangium]|uniref:TerC family protein n=2 Tax=Polyangium TaxID=55 RepID=A0A4U1JBA7_9BACT|nr:MULTISPECIES: TerC family protein [Polyangium]MDI1428012.1 TerC family protein [Polyangium sorediatum]TKD06634.1 TerC family protein [Polyangium fumosum]